MASSPYDMPPLTMLRAFEAAARHGAFNEAAAELNVTPGAVSHQVKALEKWLGLTLFTRGHRRVALNEDGQKLFGVLRDSFGDMAAMCKRLQNQAEAPRVEIAATTAVSSLWLTPRVIDFWKEFEDVQINQQVSDRPFRRPLNVDLAIEYRDKAPSDPICHRLFGDELVPVCAPQVAERLAGAGLADLAGETLIHLEARDENWTSWKRWFELMGFNEDISDGRRVNNYSIAVQLAQEGAGIALGWRRLIAPVLDQGTLVPLNMSTKAPGAFYLVGKGTELSAGAQVLFDWMVHHQVN